MLIAVCSIRSLYFYQLKINLFLNTNLTAVSNLDLHIINPSKVKNWNEIILNFPDYSFFHSSNWAKLIERTYNYKSNYFVFKDGNNYDAILPLMVVNSSLTGKRAVSLPFTDYCEPLISNQQEFKKILNEVFNFCKNNNLKYYELRGGQQYLEETSPSTFDYNHTLELCDDEDVLFKKFSSNTKRNIKKAKREDISVEISNSLSALNDFYEMNCITRKKHGLPPQPKKFFNNLYEFILKTDSGFISIAKHKGKSIAASVYLLIGDKAIYKFGASLMEYQNLRANNLVMWEAIKHCAANDYKSFCFGRTEPDNEGLRRFKLGWGTEESVLNIYRYDFNRNDFITIKTKTTGFHNKIFNKAPLPVLKALGSIIYRHFG